MKSKRVFINHSFCLHLTRSCTVNALCKNHSHCGIGILADHRYCLFIYNKKRDAELETLWVDIYCNASFHRAWEEKAKTDLGFQLQ